MTGNKDHLVLIALPICAIFKVLIECNADNVWRVFMLFLLCAAILAFVYFVGTSSFHWAWPTRSRLQTSDQDVEF